MLILQIVGNPSQDQSVVWIDAFQTLVSPVVCCEEYSLPAATRNMATRPPAWLAVPMTIAYPAKTGTGVNITTTALFLSLSDNHAAKHRIRHAKMYTGMDR